MVGTVTIPRNLDRPHTQIARLLQEDEIRRRNQEKETYRSYFNGPFFDFPFERRRLRLLSGLFTALQRQGYRATARKKDPDDFEVTIGEQTLLVSADNKEISRHGWRTEKDALRPASAPMTVELKGHVGHSVEKIWTDKPNAPVESSAMAIVTSIIVAGEMRYRDREIGHHKWLIERKQQIISDKIKRREDAIRAAETARIKAEKDKYEIVLKYRRRVRGLIETSPDGARLYWDSPDDLIPIEHRCSRFVSAAVF